MHLDNLDDHVNNPDLTFWKNKKKLTTNKQNQTWTRSLVPQEINLQTYEQGCPYSIGQAAS